MEKIILANWKMQLSYEESLDLAQNIFQQIKIFSKNIELIICPDFLTIPEISKILENSSLKLGAENSSWIEKGSFTGEVTLLNLKNLCV